MLNLPNFLRAVVDRLMRGERDLEALHRARKRMDRMRPCVFA
jgi:hypothetical protein